MSESSASYLDKTDWRRTIQNLLERSLYQVGTAYFENSIEAVLLSLDAKFPGWDARKTINDYIDELRQWYNLYKDCWYFNNGTKSRADKYSFELYLRFDFHYKIYRFIFNLLAEKRMLLWGSKEIGGGTQMEE